MSFLSLGVEQIIKVDEFFMNASIILNEAVNVTSYWSSQGKDFPERKSWFETIILWSGGWGE